MISFSEGTIQCMSETFWNASFTATYVNQKVDGSCLPGYSLYQDNQVVSGSPERHCYESEDGLSGVWNLPSQLCEGIYFDYFIIFIIF